MINDNFISYSTCGRANILLMQILVAIIIFNYTQICNFSCLHLFKQTPPNEKGPFIYIREIKVKDENYR